MPLLAEALQALLGQNEPDGAVAIDISQPSPASPCVLDMRVVLTADAPAPDLDHANRISAAMGASLRLSRPALDRLHLSLSLPA